MRNNLAFNTSEDRLTHQVVLSTIKVRRYSEGRRFELLRGANRGDIGMYALFSAFSHSHRISRKNSK